MLTGIDVRHTVMVALEVQRARRDDALERLDRRERRARTRRKIAVRVQEMAHDGLLEA